MVETAIRADVVVVGGAGHVGAPLAIVLAANGFRTVAYDIDRPKIAALAQGKMPFLEEGAAPLLMTGLSSGSLYFTGDPSVVSGIETLIVTVGTPIDEYHNPRLNVISRCLDDLLPYLSDGQLMILRSTVYPGVTDFIAEYLSERGVRLDIAFCPERVVQGKAIVELQALPQIVSGLTPRAEERAARVFGRIAPKIVPTSVKEAEFAKLVSNAYRYIQFAAANEFYMLVTSAGVDYDNVLRAIKDDYPRMRDLPGPGFAAGPCLMKDTMQLVAFNNRFTLGSSAMAINEGLPKFIVDQLTQGRDLAGKRVGILGMAFKAEIDDIRDSLSYKLAKILRFRGATVLCSDEYVADESFVPTSELVANVDVAIVAVPHEAYSRLRVPENVEVIDLWNALRSRP